MAYLCLHNYLNNLFFFYYLTQLLMICWRLLGQKMYFRGSSIKKKKICMQMGEMISDWLSGTTPQLSHM